MLQDFETVSYDLSHVVQSLVHTVVFEAESCMDQYCILPFHVKSVARKVCSTGIQRPLVQHAYPWLAS